MNGFFLGFAILTAQAAVLPRTQGTQTSPQLVCHRTYEVYRLRGKTYDRMRFPKWVFTNDQLDAGTYTAEDGNILYKVRIASLGSAQDPEFNAQLWAQIKNSRRTALYSTFGSLKRGQILDLQAYPGITTTRRETIASILMRCQLE